MSWNNLTFQKNSKPKARFIFWLHIQSRLLTADRPNGWGLDVDTKCSLCQQHEETNEHLLITSMVSGSIWERLMRWISKPPPTNNTWDQNLQGVVDRAKGKSQSAQLFELIYTEFIYHIWTERNFRIFENMNKEGEQIAMEITNGCCMRAL